MKLWILLLVSSTLGSEVRVGLVGGTLPFSIPFRGRSGVSTESWEFINPWTFYILKVEYARWIQNLAIKGGIKGSEWGGPNWDVDIYTPHGWWFTPYLMFAPVPVYVGIGKPLTLNSSFQVNFEACFWCIGKYTRDISKNHNSPYSYYEYTFSYHYYLGKFLPSISIFVGADFSVNLGMRAYYYKWRWGNYVCSDWVYTYFISVGLELPIGRFYSLQEKLGGNQ